jgi:hypothetical protein
MDLQSILAPRDQEAFLSKELGRTFFHVPGHPLKFASFCSWPDLNFVLEHHLFSAAQLRVVRAGIDIPIHSLMNPRRGILAPELTEHLRDGATLIVNGFDELHAPLRAVCEDLELALRVRARGNLYAGWRTVHGFDVHWDDHDVFVAQIDGRKLWRVYGSTEEFPLSRSTDRSKTPPEGEPLWEGVMEAGDLIYIPRGFWHVAVPCDEPSLHVTIGFSMPTGVNMLRWVLERLELEPQIRQDVPRFAGCELQASYLASIRRSVAEALQSPDLLAQFLEEMDGAAAPRPRFSLPWSATPAILPPTGKYDVVVISSRGLILREGVTDGSIEVAANGKIFKFHEASAPLLRQLSQKSHVMLDEFRVEFSELFSNKQVDEFLADLVKYGIVALVEIKGSANWRSDRNYQAA